MNQKAIILTLLIGASLYLMHTSHQNQELVYDTWKRDFGFVWKAEEDAYRRLIFMENLEIIDKHNSDPSQTYKMGLNQFSALTDKEFQTTYLTPRKNPNL